MAESSKILLGLPNLPPEQIDPKLWGEFLTVYRAIQNLLNGVSQYGGIDPPTDAERAVMDPTAYLLGTNVERWYPTASVAITRGQIVRVLAGASNQVALAAADNILNGPAIGIANETKGIGQNIEIILGGVTDAIGGMVPGTLYYLATAVAGAVQNLRPIVPGQYIQPIGWAMTSNQMYLRPSSYVHIL